MSCSVVYLNASLYFTRCRPVLIACVGSYFILMGVLTLYTTFKEKGIFVAVVQKDPAGLDPDSQWEAASLLTKFDGSSWMPAEPAIMRSSY